ncbi:GTP 3',8-cyclase MoaA [Niallia sp. 03133]|uniref:GTP 3',8-cyclase MoaA n=1 Tax=Niallia sp. 03133 TaxID=3458060 RepID=UPI004043C482
MLNSNDITIDQYKRPLRDIRISVTDQCNFRCTYCMPAEIFGADYPFLTKDNLLTFAEISKLIRAFADLGVEKVRLTGGEPLLRKNLHELVHTITTIEGIQDIALTTNGVLLPKYAKQLKTAGLHRVNVSLDAIEDEVFKKINGRSVGVKPVLKGIYAARDAGLNVKINMVVKKGMNDDQIVSMADFWKKEGITLRFIEFMDVGCSNGWNLNEVITKNELINKLKKHYDLEPIDAEYFGEVAKRYRYDGSNTEVGFVSSVSESFCSSCTRARVSAEGKFYTCLFASSGYDLRSLLRRNASNEQIRLAIQKIWMGRKDRYSDERTEEKAKSRKKIEMSYIGG